MTDDPEFTVHKAAGYMRISDELAMDYGLIPDTRPPVHIPWHRRLRWRLNDRWYQLRHRIGFWIAGYTPEDW